MPPGGMKSPRQRLPPSTSTFMASGSFQEDRSKWVPDEEVLACPMCAKQFKGFRGRHHCRACGRVVCGDCSKGSLRLQGPGSAKERVCDSCVDRRQHHRSAADEVDDRSRVEASLKENLAEKLKQANLHKEFLNKVCSEGDDEPTALLPAGPASADVCRRPGPPPAEDRARGQWQASAARLYAQRQDSGRLRQECENLETALQARVSTNEALESGIGRFEQQLRGRDKVLADTEQLKANHVRLLEELLRLDQRTGVLTAQLQSSSFASNLFGGSAGGDQESGGRDWRRRVCCMRPSYSLPPPPQSPDVLNRQ